MQGAARRVRAALPVALAPCGGPGAAPVDAQEALLRQRRHAGLRGPGQESAAARPVCPDLASGGQLVPTLIRLPGYPLFLAFCFRVFGMENYFAAACVQIALDLLGCLLLAGFVRRIVPAAASRGAAHGSVVAGRALSLHRFLCGRCRLPKRSRSLCWRWPCGRWRGSVMIPAG